jgi:outer membrane biosynthesis protein TonB
MEMLEPAAMPRSGLTKQQKIIGGAIGGALLLGVVLLLALRSAPVPAPPASDPKVEPKVEAPKPPEPKVEPKVEAPKPPEPAVEAPKPPEPRVEPKPAVVEAPPEPSTPRAPRAPREPAVASAETLDSPKPRRIGGRRVVLDESRPAQVAPAPAVPAGEDPATVARAREAYLSGNTKLFIGDTDGAVAAYRKTLNIYPGYVAGYRGLGLAYAEQNNIEEALGAFRTYVKNVPAAKDIPLIRKRMEMLERKR